MVSVERLHDWNESLTEAITCIGKQSFPTELVASLRHLIDFDVCMVFAYGDAQGSKALFHTTHGEQTRILIDEYLLGPHLLDPFYAAATSGRSSGFGAMRQLAPDQFYRSEFYRHHYVQTGIADEIGIFFPVAGERVAVLSVTKQKPNRIFTEREKRIFAATVPIIEILGSRHWGEKTIIEPVPHSSRTVDQLFESFGEDVLTHREQEIIDLVLKGHSSLSIGHVLEISPGTVKIHRKNAYSKLGVTSQAELFSKFLTVLQTRLDR